MGATSLMYYQEAFYKGAPHILTLDWTITAATTVSATPMGASPASMVVFSAIASQAVIDNFLGTTSEFNYLAFDSTSMGADAMGVIVNMKGQAADLLHVESTCCSNTGFSDMVTRWSAKSATLTNTTLVTEAALGAYGNIAFKINWGNTPDFDALTSGLIVSKIAWIAK